jgi:AcrR family transcriptional regulator
VTSAARLSAAERREQIMDAATAVILDAGVAECTLEGVAARAGVSKALVYKHFANREDLLAAILAREYEILRGRGVSPRSPELPFETLLAAGNQRAFSYLHDRGPILRTLFSERKVAQLLSRADREERAELTRFYADKIAETYAVSRDLAHMGTLLTINAPAAATRALKSYGVSPEEAAEFWTVFILGGWAAASAKYGARRPKRRSNEPDKP